jgi:succinate-acetate transporter protein
LISVSSLGCTFLGWQAAGGGGAATVGVCYFFGGLLQIIGSILEWIIGNTFPFIVFGSFGGFLAVRNNRES